MKRIIFTLLFLSACIFAFATGGNEATADGSGVVNLRFTTWTSNKTQLDLFRSMAEDFNKSQDQYKVKLNIDSIPFGDYVQKITLQLSGSNPPDIGWLVETSAPTFVNAGVLDDLSKELQLYNFEDFSQGAMGLWTKNGSVFGVPFSTSPFIVIYNKTIFEHAGIPNPSELEASGDWTWEKFREISKAIKDKTGIYGFQGMDGAAYSTRIWHNLIPIIRAYGGDAWDDSGNVLINSPEAARAVRLFHDMVYVDSSVVPPGDLSDFYAGNAGMTVGQISRVSKLKDVSWEWDIAPMPQGPEKDLSYTIGQAAVVAFSSSKNRNAARAFVAFMTNEDNVAQMTKFWPPARMSVMDSSIFLSENPFISNESMLNAVVPGLKKGKVLPSHEKFPQIQLVASGEFDKLWNKDADIDAILKLLEEAIKSQM